MCQPDVHRPTEFAAVHSLGDRCCRPEAARDRGHEETEGRRNSKAGRGGDCSLSICLHRCCSPVCISRQPDGSWRTVRACLTRAYVHVLMCVRARGRCGTCRPRWRRWASSSQTCSRCVRAHTCTVLHRTDSLCSCPLGTMSASISSYTSALCATVRPPVLALQEVLDRMSQRIEVTHSNWDPEGGPSCVLRAGVHCRALCRHPGMQMRPLAWLACV